MSNKGELRRFASFIRRRDEAKAKPARTTREYFCTILPKHLFPEFALFYL